MGRLLFLWSFTLCALAAAACLNPVVDVRNNTLTPAVISDGNPLNNNLVYGAGTCIYTITTNTPGMVQQVNIAYNLGGNYDRLLFYDGATTAAPLISTATGASALTGANIYSTGPSITILLKTDELPHRGGLLASVSASAAPVHCQFNQTVTYTGNSYTVGGTTFSEPATQLANAPYMRGGVCNWYIQRTATHNGMSVALNFQGLSLGLGDLVYVYDAANDSVPAALVSATGNPTVYLASPMALVKFVSSDWDKIGFLGFSFTVRGNANKPHCSGRQMVNMTGVTSSTLYSEPLSILFWNYENHGVGLTCEWLFYTSNGQALSFRPDVVKVSHTSTLTAYDGQTTAAPVLMTNTRDWNNNRYASTQPYLLVRLATSAYDAPSNGIQFYVSATPISSTCPAGDTIFTSGSGSFGAPFPTVPNTPYLPNTACRFYLNNTLSNRISLVFTSSNINAGDSLSIYTIDPVTDQQTLYRQLIGNPASDVTTSMNFVERRVLVVFQSGPLQGSAYGFAMDYRFFNQSNQCTYGATLSGSNQNLRVFPNGGSNLKSMLYAGPLNCSWLCTASAGSFMSIYVNDFSLAPGTSLVMYDGTNASAPVLANYTGSFQLTTTAVVAGTTRRLFVTLTSTVPGNTTSWGIDAFTVAGTAPTTPISCPNAGTLYPMSFNDPATVVRSANPAGNLANHGRLIDCFWNFTRADVNGSTIGFLVDLQSLCKVPEDQVTIYDGGDFNAPILFQSNGYQSSFNFAPTWTFTTLSRNMVIRYKSGNYQGGSFKASVTAAASPSSPQLCSNGVTMVTSPDSQFTYWNQISVTANPAINVQPGMNCTWLFDRGTGGSQLRDNNVWEIGLYPVYGDAGNIPPFYPGIVSFGAYDGTTMQDRLMIDYTNTTSYTYGSGRYMLVNFQSAPNVQIPPTWGFIMWYRRVTKPVHCSGFAPLYLALPNTLSNYPNWDVQQVANYPGSHYCTWLITSAPGAMVLISDIDQRLKGAETVSVYDGFDETAPALAILDQYSDVWSLHSTGHAIYIVYDTHGPSTGFGFQMQYETTIIMPPSCSGPRLIPFRPTGAPYTWGSAQNLNTPDAMFVANNQAASGYMLPEAPNQNCTFEIALPAYSQIAIKGVVALPAGYIKVYNNDVVVAYVTGVVNTPSVFNLCGRVWFEVYIGPNAGDRSHWVVTLSGSFQKAQQLLRCQADDEMPCGSPAQILASNPYDLLPYINCTTLNTVSMPNAYPYSLPNLRFVAGDLAANGWTIGNQIVGYGDLDFPSLVAANCISLNNVALMSAFNLSSLVAVDDIKTYNVYTPGIYLRNLYWADQLCWETLPTPLIIDLGALVYARTVDVSQCVQLRTLVTNSLQIAFTVSVQDSGKVGCVSLPRLEQFYQVLISGTQQSYFSLPAVHGNNGIHGSVTLETMSNLEIVDLASVTGLQSLYVVSSPQVTSVLVPNLGYVYGPLQLSSVRLASFGTAALQVLRVFEISGVAYLNSLVLPNLNYVGSFTLSDTTLTTLNLPNLQIVNADFELTRNYALSVLNMCNLTSADAVQVSQCPSLSCYETRLLFGDAGADTSSAVPPECDGTLQGSFGCREDMLRVVNTSVCGFTLPCIQREISASYVDKRTQVLIPAGTYTGCSNGALTTNGKLITVRGHGQGSTVIDCQGSGRAFVISQGEGRKLTLQDMTLLDGSADTGGLMLIDGASPSLHRITFVSGAATDSDGGGLAVIGSNAWPLLDRVIFSGNQAAGAGGAVSVNGARITIGNCTFDANTAVKQGGALYLTALPGLIGVGDSAFLGNNAGQAGAIFTDSPLTLSRGNFTGNSATQFAGAVAAVPVDPGRTMWLNISDSQFVGNAGASGGGVYGFSSSVSIVNCGFHENTAGQDGGGLALLCSPSYRILQGITGSCDVHLHMLGSTLDGNSAAGNGGGVTVADAQAYIQGGVVSGNGAMGSGGGLYTRASVIVARTLTVAGNTAAATGGGLYCEPFAGTCDATGLTLSSNVATVAGGGAYMCTAACKPSSGPSSTIVPDLKGANTFADNVGGYGGDLATDPVTLAWALAPAATVISGRSISSDDSDTITVGVSDYYGSLVNAADLVLPVSLDVLFANGSVGTAVRVSGAQTALVVSGTASFAGVTLQGPLSALDASYKLRARLSNGISVTSTVVVASCAAGMGRASPTGLVVCVDCLPGTASEGAASNYLCVPCQPGSAAATGSMTACTMCPANTRAAAAGASSCDACLSGYTAPPGSADCVADAAALVPPPPQILGPAIGASAGVLVLIIIGALCLWRLARKKTMQKYYLDSDATVRAGGAEETPLQKSVKRIIGAASTTRAGGGVFADVYKAKHEGRWIALKVMKKEMVGHMEAQQEFRREAVALSRVGEMKHRGVVEVVFFLERNPMCVGMEFCSNGTLKRLLVTQSLSTQDKVRFAAETASAMAAVHSKDVVHLDLKTDNLLLDDDMHIKVADFGISRILGEGSPNVTPFASAAPSAAQPQHTGSISHNPLFGENGAGNGAEMASQRPMSIGPYDSTDSGGTVATQRDSMHFPSMVVAPAAGANTAFTPQYADPLRIKEGTVLSDEFLRKTDVFSFGMVMWALFKQEEPYTGIPVEQLIAELKADPGKRPPPIQDIHPGYGELMQSSWHVTPSARPTFTSLETSLTRLLRDEFGVDAAGASSEFGSVRKK